MREIVWLESAVDDVVRLRAFIAKENPAAAENAARVIKNAVTRLLEVPESGKPVEGLAEYRDLLVRFGAGGYVFRYRVHMDTVYIVHIRHYREAGFWK